jgi:hypothetical protein
LFGDLPRSYLEGALALVMQLVWVGMMGIAFAFLIPHVTSQGYLLKGAFFGVAAGFIFYIVPSLFEVTFLDEQSLSTVASNYC